jgi:gamma-glutamylcyclotransferase (GGCT)/AIG2-like uncharacterized protein YtfP
MGKHRIFVYGTLKQDHRDHRFLKNALRVGTTVTADASFRMVELSSRSSPGLRSPGVREDGEGYIAGEVYEVDNQTRTELDKLEKEGVQYKRHLVSLSGMELLRRSICSLQRMSRSAKHPKE